MTICSLDALLSQFWTSEVCCSMSSSNCYFLICIEVSQEQVVWYAYLLNNFPQFVVIHTIKGFIIVNEAEVDVFLEFPCYFYNAADVGHLSSDSSASSKSSLNIWKFSVHVLWKPSLKDFEHYLPSMWNKHNCEVVWTFLDTVLLWDRNVSWLESSVQQNIIEMIWSSK